MDRKTKIGFGGGCHWCTEAVFQSLKGVEKVEQGYVASIDENNTFSEAVIVHFNPKEITLKALIEIHLHTHKSTSNHSMREKYRSAIYSFSKEQEYESKEIIKNLQKDFDDKIITKVFPFSEFKVSREAIQNYYQKNPNKPFCKAFINPKLKLLLKQFSVYTNQEKLNHLRTNEKHETQYSK
ncbi:peptide-methionine (S)-S-oxide reductase [Ichthyenterobacterium magnum]|uniref:peptide-methionine (S)-S-oxide reductase n=1 Tax=Ichthyenterobacterium magnum TaxID=1230530 RepID=A0A420DW31_9FLAO|nr:peptide-methionine (S)-S-oxide reductase [Ichthyenterobacterium magnum]RKE98434.1 peptide-methionine (S)-S-oxide reductase [Ichthyenterobacterium magnum]